MKTPTDHGIVTTESLRTLRSAAIWKTHHPLAFSSVRLPPWTTFTLLINEITAYSLSFSISLFSPPTFLPSCSHSLRLPNTYKSSFRFYSFVLVLPCPTLLLVARSIIYPLQFLLRYACTCLTRLKSLSYWQLVLHNAFA